MKKIDTILHPDHTEKFKGFASPNTTPTPDELFDRFLADLSGAEIKVMLYIVRRTLGFKKDADRISLTQICGGIRTKAGRQLDRGTGLSLSTAKVAVKSLERRGLIVVDRVQEESGYNCVNAYRLRFQEERAR